MIITQNEKPVFNFLKMVFEFNKKSHDEENMIVGLKNRLVFKTKQISGIFIYQSDAIGKDYDFGKGIIYDIKLMDSGAYELCKNNDRRFSKDSIYYKAADRIISTYNNADGKFDMDRSYECKAALIAENTGIWIEDNAISIFNRFPEWEISKSNDVLCIENVSMYDMNNTQVNLIFLLNLDDNPKKKYIKQNKLDVDKKEIDIGGTVDGDS